MKNSGIKVKAKESGFRKGTTEHSLSPFKEAGKFRKINEWW